MQIWIIENDYVIIENCITKLTVYELTIDINNRPYNEHVLIG